MLSGEYFYKMRVFCHIYMLIFINKKGRTDDRWERKKVTLRNLHKKGGDSVPKQRILTLV